MQSGRVRIIWIDDDPEHRDDATQLKEKRKEELDVDFRFYWQLEDFLYNAQDQVDLYLVDDELVLGKSPTSRPNRRRGLSVAAQIRERSPEVPIYLFTNFPDRYGIETALAEAAESISDDILEYKTVQRQGDTILYSDAIDYRLIRESPRGALRTIFDLLKAPQDEYGRISFALPPSLRAGLEAQSDSKRTLGNAIAFAKWTKRTFLKLPGFVYDPLYSATRLGMTERAFIKYASVFESAIYAGIFAKTRGTLYWNSMLQDVIFKMAKEKIPKDDTTNLQTLTKRVFDLDDSETAKCIVCNSEYPDTIGLAEDDDTYMQPVHYRCSAVHPKQPRVLYFDQIRQFKEEE